MNMTAKQILALCAGVFWAVCSQACVEANSDAYGGTVTNRCPYPVNISFCFGDCENAPRGRNVPTAPGFSKQISNTPHVKFKFQFCQAPAFPDGQGGCTKS
jgi:hypothetical protein